MDYFLKDMGKHAIMRGNIYKQNIASKE